MGLVTFGVVGQSSSVCYSVENHGEMLDFLPKFVRLVKK